MTRRQTEGKRQRGKGRRFWRDSWEEKKIQEENDRRVKKKKGVGGADGRKRRYNRRTKEE